MASRNEIHKLGCELGVAVEIASMATYRFCATAENENRRWRVVIRTWKQDSTSADSVSGFARMAYLLRVEHLLVSLFSGPSARTSRTASRSEEHTSELQS